MTKECRCVGPFCKCYGHEVLKDGRRARLTMLDARPAADARDAYRAMCTSLSDAWQAPHGADAAGDAAEAKRSQALADARAAGASDADAAAWAARQAHRAWLSAAWQR
jgi:hypothetical protein